MTATPASMTGWNPTSTIRAGMIPALDSQEPFSAIPRPALAPQADTPPHPRPRTDQPCNHRIGPRDRLGQTSAGRRRRHPPSHGRQRRSRRRFPDDSIPVRSRRSRAGEPASRSPPPNATSNLRPRSPGSGARPTAPTPSTVTCTATRTHYLVSGAGTPVRPEQFTPFWFRTFRYLRLTDHHRRRRRADPVR